MMKAEVSGNSIEVTFSPSEALLLGLSVLFVLVLTVLAGWQVAFVALGLSLLGAGAVDAAQKADLKILEGNGLHGVDREGDSPGPAAGRP